MKTKGLAVLLAFLLLAAQGWALDGVEFNYNGMVRTKACRSTASGSSSSRSSAARLTTDWVNDGVALDGMNPRPPS